MEVYRKQMLLSFKKPITTFFILTFCFSWLFWIPMIFIGKEVFLLRVLGTYGPTTIALFITGIREKKKGVVELLESFRRWKVGIFWYLFSLFSTAVLTILSISIYLSLERNNLVFNELSKIYLVVPVFLFVLIFSVLGEEIGWRGFALPKLQEKIGPLRASLLIGVVWGFWHLPLFFIEGNFHQDIPLWLFILQDVALSIVMCWMYNHTKGSLLIIHLFHAASNTTLGVLPILPMDTGGDLLPLYILCGFLVILALFIVLTGNLGKPTKKPLKETINTIV
jgi:membrane protease YdiL (CAAX protease family)